MLSVLSDSFKLAGTSCAMYPGLLIQFRLVELSPSSKSARSLAIAARNLEPTMAGHRLAMASLSQQPARGVSAATAIALEPTAAINLEQNNDIL